VLSSCGAKAIIEWIWIRDIVDHTWEILRLRQFRAVIASSKSLFEDLASKCGSNEDDREAESAHRLLAHIKHYQVLDRLIASLERRRDQSLAQVDFSVAQRLRQASARSMQGSSTDQRLPRPNCQTDDFPA
jgi:hypothetical protein